MIDEVIVIEGDQVIMQPKDDAGRLSVMNSSSIQDKEDNCEKRGLQFDKSNIPMAKVKDNKMNDKKGQQCVVVAKRN